jgi:hypothetical protein
MGRKYRGADGWIHYEGEERPRRYENQDPVQHRSVPKRADARKKRKGDPVGDAMVVGTVVCCGVVPVLAVLAVVLGAFYKLLSWLWG